MDMVGIAKEIATKAHEGQKRWGGEPYITHPAAIAKLVEYLGWHEKTVALGWLHDVLEDTNITVADLTLAGIPNDVIESLVAITHKDDEFYLDYLLRVVKNPSAALVKTLDLCHNLSTSKTGYKHTREKWIMAQWILKKHGYLVPEELNTSEKLLAILESK